MTDFSNTERNTRLALNTSVSSVSSIVPFIGHTKPSNLPFIGKKQPLDRIQRKIGGFTLVELMITLVVSGILLGIAVPSFQNSVKNNRMVSQINDLLADLIFARSEALKRSRDVHICKSSNPNLASPVCNATNTDPWTTGWITWVDKNSNGVLNSPAEILRINEGLSSPNNTLTTADAAIQNEIVFAKLGILTNSGGTLNLCDDRGSSHGRTMSITTAGRPTIGRNPTC